MRLDVTSDEGSGVSFRSYPRICAIRSSVGSTCPAVYKRDLPSPPFPILFFFSSSSKFYLSYFNTLLKHLSKNKLITSLNNSLKANSHTNNNTMSTPMKFLELSNKVSEPFVIPNVSPTSPPLAPSDSQAPSPVLDSTICRDRQISIVELN